MAVGNDSLGTLHPVPGLRLATVSAGIKKPGRRDLVLMELAPGAVAAAVFTRNAFCAAPVTVAREHLQAFARCAPQVRAVLADDPGAGKTIMAGLLLKELKIRGLVRRILIVTTANLTLQ